MNRPHTITIYNSFKDENGNIKYIKHKLDNVYWYGTDSINISGKGVVESNSINIIIDTKENLGKYIPKENYQGNKDTYTLDTGIRIVYGEGPDITSLNELETYKQISVLSFDINIISSPIDNILILGR